MQGREKNDLSRAMGDEPLLTVSSRASRSVAIEPLGKASTCSCSTYSTAAMTALVDVRLWGLLRDERTPIEASQD